jgi:hypothetical protein
MVPSKNELHHLTVKRHLPDDARAGQLSTAARLEQRETIIA